MAAKSPVHVTVTGAAGQIGYACCSGSRSGQLFGPDQPVVLRLLEIEPAMKALEGVAMELETARSPCSATSSTTTDPDDAFDGTSWALLVGAIPRKAGMERGDLLPSTAGSSVRRAGRSTSQRRGRRARPGGRQPLQHQLPDRRGRTRRRCPRDRWFAMTRLDENRAQEPAGQEGRGAGVDGHQHGHLGQPLGDPVP